MKAPWRAPVVAAAVLAVHLGLLWWSAGGAPLIGSPVHHDDFRNLSYASLSELPSLAVRPISTAVLGFLSVCGERTYYLALHLLVVAYVTLVVCFMLRLFPEQGSTGALLVLASIVGALSFDHVPEYVFYSGLVTNLVSATTGLAALLLLDRDVRGTRARLAVACGTALFAASLLAKEDFAAAVFVALALRAIEQGRLRRGRGCGAWLVLAALATALGLFLAWSLGQGRASFLRSAAEAYRPDFTPASLARTTLEYLTCSIGASFATGVQLAVLTIVLLAGRATAARRSLGVLAVTLALVAPYAALPRHFYPYYAFNWSVWQAASLLALGPVLEGAPRKWKRVAAAGLALVLAAWVVATHPRRAEVARWYAHEAARNRVTVAALRDLGETLRPWRIVGIAGAGPLDPAPRLGRGGAAGRPASEPPPGAHHRRRRDAAADDSLCGRSRSVRPDPTHARRTARHPACVRRERPRGDHGGVGQPQAGRDPRRQPGRTGVHRVHRERPSRDREVGAGRNDVLPAGPE